MQQAIIGQKPPLLSVAQWVQGKPTNFDQLVGKVVLVEVFQVNCPGCFLYSLPHAVDLYRRYSDQGLTVLGIATAFEDYDKNTLDNLKLLLNTGQVIGETQRLLDQYNQLADGKLTYAIPFPVAMDRLIEREQDITPQDVEHFIETNFPQFNQQNADSRQRIRQQIHGYLQSRQYSAETFDRFALRGTPSHLVVNKKGYLSACEFGSFPELEDLLRNLLRQ